MRTLRTTTTGTTSTAIPCYYKVFLIGYCCCCYYLCTYQYLLGGGNNNGIIIVVESFAVLKQQHQQQQQSNRVNHINSATSTLTSNKKRILFGVSSKSSSLSSSSTTILKLSLGNNNYLNQLSFLDDNDNNNNNETSTSTSTSTSTATPISDNNDNNENIISWTARAEARMMSTTTSTTSTSTRPSRIISAIQTQTQSQEQQLDNDSTSSNWKSATSTGSTDSSGGSDSLSSTTQQTQQQQQQQYPIMPSSTDSSSMQSQFTEQQPRSVVGIDHTQTTTDSTTGGTTDLGTTDLTRTGTTSTNTNTPNSPTKELLQLTIDEIVYNERQRQIKLQQHLDMLVQQNKEQKLQQDLYVQTRYQQQLQQPTSSITNTNTKNDDGGVDQYQSQFRSYYDSYYNTKQNSYNNLYNNTVAAQQTTATAAAASTTTSTIISPNQYLYSDDNNQQVQYHPSNNNYNTNNNNNNVFVSASSSSNSDRADTAAVSMNSNSHITTGTTGSTTYNYDNGDDATMRLWKYLQSITSVESSKTSTISLSSSLETTVPTILSSSSTTGSTESNWSGNNYPTGTSTGIPLEDATSTGTSTGGISVADSEQSNYNNNNSQDDGSNGIVDYDKFINDIITQARTIVGGHNSHDSNNDLLNVTKATTTVGMTTTTTISISLPPSKTNNNNNNNNNTITTFTISHDNKNNNNNNNNNVINDRHDSNDITDAATTGLPQTIDNTPTRMDDIIDKAILSESQSVLNTQDSTTNTNNYNMEKIYHENDIDTRSYSNDYFTSELTIGSTDTVETNNVNYNNDDNIQSTSTESSGSTHTSNDDEDFDFSKYRQALEDSQRLLKMFNKYEQKEPTQSSSSSQQKQRLNDTSSHQGRTTSTGGDGGSAGMTMNRKSGKPTSPPLSQPVQQVVPRRKSVFVADLINKNEADQKQQPQKHDTTVNDKRSNSTNDDVGNYDAVVEDSIQLLAMLKELREEMGLIESEISTSEGSATSTSTHGKEYKDFMNLPTIDDLHDKDLIISSSRSTKKDTVNDCIKKVKISTTSSSTTSTGSNKYTSSTNDQRQQQQQQPPLSRVFEPKLDEVHTRRSFGISDNISTGDRDSNDKRWSNPSTRVNVASEPIKNDSNKKNDDDVDKTISSTNTGSVPEDTTTTSSSNILLDRLEDTEQSNRKSVDTQSKDDDTTTTTRSTTTTVPKSDSASAPRQATTVPSPTPAAAGPPIFSTSSSYSSDRVPTVLMSNPFQEEMSKHITGNKGRRSTTQSPDVPLQQQEQEQQQLDENQNENRNETPPDRITVPAHDSREDTRMTQPDPLPNRDDTFTTNEREAPAQIPAPTPAAPIFSQSSSYSNDRVPTVLMSNPFLEEMSKHITGNKGSRSTTQSSDAASQQQEQQQLVDTPNDIRNEMPPDRISVPAHDSSEDIRMTQSEEARNGLQNDPLPSRDDEFTRIDSVAPTQMPAPTPAAPIFSQSSSYSSDRVPTVLMSNPFEEEMSKHITGNRGSRNTQSADVASQQQEHQQLFDNQNETPPNAVSAPKSDTREDRSMSQSEETRNAIQNDPLPSRDDAFTRIDSVAPTQMPAPTPAAPIFSQSSSYSSDRVPTVLMSNPFEEEMSKHITGKRGSGNTQSADVASQQQEHQQLFDKKNEIANETPPDAVTARKPDNREDRRTSQSEETRNAIQNDPLPSRDDEFTRIDSVAPTQMPAPTPAAPVFSQSSSYSSDRVPTVLMSNPFEEEMGKHITGKRGSGNTQNSDMTPTLSQPIVGTTKSQTDVESNVVASNRASNLKERILAVTNDSENISTTKKGDNTVESSNKSNKMQVCFDDVVDSWLNPGPTVNSALPMDGEQSAEARSREEMNHDILANDTGVEIASSSPSSSSPTNADANSPKVRSGSGDPKVSTASNPIDCSSENDLPTPSITMTPVLDSSLMSINDGEPTVLRSNPLKEEMNRHVGSTKDRDTVSKTSQIPSNHMRRSDPDSNSIEGNLPNQINQSSDNTISYPIAREDTRQRESSSRPSSTTPNQADADSLGSNWAGHRNVIADEVAKNSDSNLVVQDRFTNVGNTDEMNVAKEVKDYSSSGFSPPFEDDNAPRPTPPDFTEDWKTSWTSPPVSSGQVTRIDPYDGIAPTPAAPVYSASSSTSNGRVPTSIMSNPFQEEMSKHIGSKTNRKKQVEAATAASPLPSARTMSEPINTQKFTTASTSVTNDPFLQTNQQTELQRSLIDSSSNDNSVSKQSDTVENDIRVQGDIDQMKGSQIRPTTQGGDRTMQTSTTGVSNGEDLKSDTNKTHREHLTLSTSGLAQTSHVTTDNGLDNASQERVTEKVTSTPAQVDSISHSGVVPTVPRFEDLSRVNAISTQSRHNPRTEEQPSLDVISKSKLVTESIKETDSNNNLNGLTAHEGETNGSKMNHGVTQEYASSTFKHNYFDIASAMKRHNRPQNEDTFAVDNKVDHEDISKEVKAATTSMSEIKKVGTGTTTLKTQVDQLSPQKVQALKPKVPTVTENSRASNGNANDETLSDTLVVMEDCMPIQKKLRDELSDSRMDSSVRSNSKQRISQNRTAVGAENNKKSNLGSNQIQITSTDKINTAKSVEASTAFVRRKSFSKDLSSGGKAVYKTKPIPARQQLDETPPQLTDTVDATKDIGMINRAVSHHTSTQKKGHSRENQQTDLKTAKLLDQHTSNDSLNTSFHRCMNSTKRSNQHVVPSEGILPCEISDAFPVDESDGINLIENDVNHTIIPLLNHEDHQVLENVSNLKTTATLAATMQNFSNGTDKSSSSEIKPMKQLQERAIKASRSVDMSNASIGTGRDSLSSNGNSTIAHSMKSNSSIHDNQDHCNDINFGNDNSTSSQPRNNRIIDAAQGGSSELLCYDSLNEKDDKTRIKQSKHKTLGIATIRPGNTENSGMLGIVENCISIKAGLNSSIATNSSSLSNGRSTIRNHFISSPCDESELSSEIQAIIWNQSSILNKTYIPENENPKANYSNVSNNETMLMSSFDGLKSWINSTFLKLSKVE